MEDEKTMNEELREITPDFPLKTDSYSVPDRYFEKFPGNILNRWHQEQSDKVKDRWMWSVMKVAAVVTAILAGTWFFLQEHAQKEIPDVTAQEAYQYIHEHIDEFVELMEPSTERSSYLPSEIPVEHIEEYLMEELEVEELDEELFN